MLPINQPGGPDEGGNPSGAQLTRIVAGRTLPVRIVDLPHARLKFYDENPRIHETLHAQGQAPTQTEIEEHLTGLDHVRKLAANIAVEGGLHDPVIVHGGTMEVLEGNRRLAAYRLLSKTKGRRWDNIRCEVLPADIEDDIVFSLLAQYHINGKLAWVPFAQAGFFYRAFIQDESKRSRQEKIENLALRGGNITVQRARHLIDTYGFMLDAEDATADHWSHYDEYFKSRDIRRARETFPDLDARFIGIVPNIPAEDVRKLAKICTQEKILKRFVAGSIDLEKAHQQYLDSGADADAYQKFHRFRTWLAREGVVDEILQHGAGERQKVLLEVKKLELLTRKLRTSLEGEQVHEPMKPRRRVTS